MPVGAYERVKAFLGAMAYPRIPPFEETAGPYPFVTISRQTGTGGHSLASAILTELEKEHEESLFHGWQILDAELCQRILQDAKLKVPFESLIREDFHSETEDIFYQALVDRSPQETVTHKIFKAIHVLADRGKMVFIGRGAAFLTASHPLGIHLRLVAPLPARVDRLMALRHLSEKAAREAIAEQDAARAQLVRHYFGKDINDPLLYHAVWNTQRTPIEEIAPLVVKMILRRSSLLVPT